MNTEQWTRTVPEVGTRSSLFRRPPMRTLSTMLSDAPIEFTTVEPPPTSPLAIRSIRGILERVYALGRKTTLPIATRDTDPQKLGTPA